MRSRFCLAFALFVAVPLWSQVNDNGAPANNNPVADDARMLTPPAVTGAAYPIAPEAEERSNYLRAGVIFNTAYTDNVLAGLTARPVSDIDYSVWPTITLDETTSRLHSTLTYAPGFTFYQRTNGRNEADQTAGVDVQYRLSPHLTLSMRDSFQKASSIFNQPNSFSGAPVYGTAQVPTAAVIAPVADRLTNNANAELSYQFSRTGMIGGSAMFTNLHFPNPIEVPGLYDSSSRGASAFYSHRLSKRHYIGAQYQYSRILAFPVGPQFETLTHTIFGFYTIYFTPSFSLSLSAGPQYYQTTQSSLLNSHSWEPASTASLGWQGRHATFAASYSRTVTGGGGLLGAFESNTANASTRWQLTRAWNVGGAASYSIFKSLVSLPVAGNGQGGHSVSGNVSLRHPIGQHFEAELGYTRLHQSYGGIPLIATAPDTNVESISISYHFNRPLGR